MFIEKKIFLTFERSIELNRFMPLDAYFKVEYGNPCFRIFNPNSTKLLLRQIALKYNEICFWKILNFCIFPVLGNLIKCRQNVGG